MVTTTCQELAGVACTTPLQGSTLDELKQAVFAHAQKDHSDIVQRMSPQDQAKMMQRIESIYTQKSATASAR